MGVTNAICNLERKLVFLHSLYRTNLLNMAHGTVLLVKVTLKV